MIEADARTPALAHVERDVDRIILGREQIAARIAELGRDIRAELEDLPGDAEVVIVPILTGAIIFLADLIRHLPHKVRISVLAASSYDGARTESRGDVRLSALPEDLRGRYVLIVDDILDSGTTIRRVRAEISKRDPSLLRACVLLRKNIPSALETPCEYVGFDIPDEFVVGYGLDYDGYYRNLPDIGVLKKDAL